MVRLYAAAADVWEAGTEPDNSDTLLRAASRTVDALLRSRVYDVDDAGMPTDTDVATAMKDATVAIVQELQATGILNAGGTTAWQSVAIGGVSLSGRQPSPGTVLVAGIPVPPVALVHLADVGRMTVVIAGGDLWGSA